MDRTAEEFVHRVPDGRWFVGRYGEYECLGLFDDARAAAEALWRSAGPDGPDDEAILMLHRLSWLGLDRSAIRRSAESSRQRKE